MINYIIAFLAGFLICLVIAYIVFRFLLAESPMEKIKRIEEEEYYKEGKK